MRGLYKLYYQERKYYESVWQMIYLSDWFDPIYKSYTNTISFKQKIQRFFYYGKIGMQTRDYDAYGFYTLTEAHIRRVKNFMQSDDTHLEWNDSNDSKPMRRLSELHALSEYMNSDNQYIGPNCKSYYDKYGNDISIESGQIVRRKVDKKQKTELKIAREKDRLLYQTRRRRYFYLLEKYVDQFWD